MLHGERRSHRQPHHGQQIAERDLASAHQAYQVILGLGASRPCLECIRQSGRALSQPRVSAFSATIFAFARFAREASTWLIAESSR